jgi:hypothetical protein
VEEKVTHGSQQSSGEFTGTRVRGPMLAVDGQGLKRLVEAGLAWLRHHQAAINALNVFPVPDGDTGTNMLLTMQSAWAEINDLPEQNAGVVAQAVAHGALMGARGNSGVILSQLWRGFARSLHNKQTFAAADLAQAMQEAADTAYKGVIKPVEGTILTVAREAAIAASQITREYGDLLVVFDYVVSQTKQAVARTPSQLPVLAEAGVVDAGGQGFYTILESPWTKRWRVPLTSVPAQRVCSGSLRPTPSPSQTTPAVRPATVTTCSSSSWARTWMWTASAPTLTPWENVPWWWATPTPSRFTSTCPIRACLSATACTAVPCAT